MTKYEEEKEDYTAFEFIDSRGKDGLYRRYRAHYIAGVVRPSKLMRCKDWNVCLKNRPVLEYTFQMTAKEIPQVRLIASTLGLEYFGLDYMRRGGDDTPFFTDVNIYPRIRSLTNTNRLANDYGKWHTFDTKCAYR